MGNSISPDAETSAYISDLIKIKAKQLARRNEFRDMDDDDLAQEFWLAWLSRAHLYDPARGASLNTFADRVINSLAATMLRDRKRLKRAGAARTVSINQTKADGDETATLAELLSAIDGARSSGTRAAEDAELIGDVLEAFRMLPPEHQEVCRMLIDGTEASVARDMGISRRQMRKAMARIRNQFEAAGFGSS